MTIQTIDAAYTGIHGQVSRTPSSELGKDDFLKLLTEQLKNQDPLEPMDDMAFVSQMSEFSSLEQLTNLNSTMTDFVSAQGTSQPDAVSLLGKTVTVQSNGESEGITGIVDAISFEGGKTYLKIGENGYTLDKVKIVTPGVA